jgi:hypothetical protein
MALNLRRKTSEIGRNDLDYRSVFPFPTYTTTSSTTSSTTTQLLHWQIAEENENKNVQTTLIVTMNFLDIPDWADSMEKRALKIER